MNMTVIHGEQTAENCESLANPRIAIVTTTAPTPKTKSTKR